MDPELLQLVADVPTADLSDVEGAREKIRQMFARLPPVAVAEDVQVTDSTAAAPDADAIRLRVYRPVGPPGPLPAILWIHGGGFVLCDLDTEHAAAAATASAVGALVVAVGYRLAPEHRFPTAVEDCYAALNWMTASATDLGIDTGRVAVCGTSAGGALAAATALLARDRGGPALCFQLLETPVTDDRLATASMDAVVEGPGWNRRNAELSWDYYLGSGRAERLTVDVSPYAAPARAEDLSGLPPAYVSTAERDPLRDEGIIYAMRLLQAGVSVELHQFPGTFHGSALLTAEVSRRQQREKVAALRRALAVERRPASAAGNDPTRPPVA